MGLLLDREADAARLSKACGMQDAQVTGHAVTCNPTFKLTAADLERLLPGAPSSWALPERRHRPVSSVQLIWRVDVDTLRSKAQKLGAAVKFVNVWSLSTTAPLGGLSFRVLSQLHWNAEKQAATVGL